MAVFKSSRGSHDRQRASHWLFLGSLSFLMIGLLACTGLSDRQATSNASQDVITDTRAPAPSNGVMTQPSSPPNRSLLGQSLPITAKAKIGSDVIQLEVARTPRQQQIGLMYRDELPADRGMLFPFNPPLRVGFWMKNVRISLDMIFMARGEVKWIARNVPPCKSDPCPTYGPNVPIDQVIELRGGRAAELGVKEGDRIEVEFLQP